MTVAPASASARANSRWLRGKNGSMKTTFMPGIVAAGDRLRSAAAGDDIALGGYVLSMMVAGFVAPYLLDTTTRFVDAAASLPDVRLALITCEPADRLPPELRHILAGHWRIDDPLDPGQIADAAAGLGQQFGRPLERLLAVLEQLQVPLGQVREHLGIAGMHAATARNFRDKAQMKTALRAAGVAGAPHRLAGSASAAVGFAPEVGVPRGGKPPARAGAKSPVRRNDPDDLKAWLDMAPPAPDRPALIEEFLTGEEGSYDSVMVDGQIVWDSVSDYLPTPLEVLRNPWMQWTVLLPRTIGPEYDGIRTAAPLALRALGLQVRADPYGVVPPAGRLGRGFRGRGPAGGRPDHRDAVLRARLRSLPRVGAADDRRQLLAAGTPLGCRRHRLPARAGRGPGPGGARPGCAAARGEVAGRRVAAAAAWPAVLGQLRGRRLRDRAAPGHRRGRQRAAAAGHHGARRAGLTAMNVLMISPGYPAEMAFFTRGLARAGVSVIGLGDQQPQALPEPARDALVHYIQAGSLAAEDAVAATVRELARQVRIDRVECLWEPYMILAARLREELGLPGLTAAQTVPFRDKEQMKQLLDVAGLRTPRHVAAQTVAGVWAAADHVGFPLIVKPVDGAGSADTYRADTPADLDAILPMVRHVPRVSVEEFIDGEEFTYDTICAGGRVLFENICQYHPRPLLTKMHEWISPMTVALRDLDAPGLRGGRDLGAAVLQVLGFRDGFTHMEWYRKADGEVVFGEIGARPPGARTVDVMNYATDADLFAAWAEAVTHGRISQSVRKRYNAASIFKRASGAGRITRYEGLDRLLAEYGEHVVALELLPVGAPRRDWRATRIADGMVIVRHPELPEAMQIAQRFAAELRLYAA